MSDGSEGLREGTGLRSGLGASDGEMVSERSVAGSVARVARVLENGALLGTFRGGKMILGLARQEKSFVGAIVRYGRENGTSGEVKSLCWLESCTSMAECGEFRARRLRCSKLLSGRDERLRTSFMTFTFSDGLMESVYDRSGS